MEYMVNETSTTKGKKEMLISEFLKMMPRTIESAVRTKNHTMIVTTKDTNGTTIVIEWTEIGGEWRNGAESFIE